MKKTILTLSDHPMSPSGVGTQTKYFIEGLLKTGRYRVISLGGAMKHPNYNPLKVDQYGDDWIIHPVDGYGTEEQIRSVLQQERPDILWFMTDPRFYGWLWEMENEIRANVPMIYYHVWDNYPLPKYNDLYYRSTDKVVCISKVTHDIVQNVSPSVESEYLPHGVNPEIFRKIKKTDKAYANIESIKNKLTCELSVGLQNKEKKIFFWNNRNARRKQSGTIIWWFGEWLDKVGHDKAVLVMHTDARDPHGQDLPHLIQTRGLDKGQVILSTQKVAPEELSALYNAADFTINIADAEGFGLATLESLSCGTPIIVNMTGGLQEQITDGTNWFGIAIKPSSKAIIGSLQVPYIYEDRISQKDFEKSLTKASNMSSKVYRKMSIQGREHVRQNYNFDAFQQRWVEIIDSTIENMGSWDSRRGYEKWKFMEITP